jgi:hypothetical protein
MAALRTRPAGVRPTEGDLYEAATRLLIPNEVVKLGW